MTIEEFAALHCQDILARAKQLGEFDLFADYPFDEIIYADDDDIPIRVINCPSGQIPIADIISLNRDEFATLYPDEDSLVAYDKYMAMFIIIEGAEVVNQIRNAMLREAQRLQNMVVPGDGVEI